VRGDKRVLGSRHRLRLLPFVLAVLGGCLWFAPSVAALTACEAKKATIDHLALTESSATGIAVEAAINPQGSETAYEFRIALRQRTTGSSELLPGGALAEGGRLPAGNSDVTVDARLSGLEPGYLYLYEVIASNLAGKTKSAAWFNDYADWTGLYPGIPYEPEVTPCELESTQLLADQIYREAQEARERTAREATERAEAEAALKRGAEAQKAPPAATPVEGACVVPRLHGDTLTVARHALERAGCRLGQVRGRSRHRRTLVVIEQSVIKGTRLVTRAVVGITLGPNHHRRQRRH
jgi:hypothetical protein